MCCLWDQQANTLAPAPAPLVNVLTHDAPPCFSLSVPMWLWLHPSSATVQHLNSATPVAAAHGPITALRGKCLLPLKASTPVLQLCLPRTCTGSACTADWQGVGLQERSGPCVVRRRHGAVWHRKGAAAPSHHHPHLVCDFKGESLAHNHVPRAAVPPVQRLFDHLPTGSWATSSA